MFLTPVPIGGEHPESARILFAMEPPAVVSRRLTVVI